MYGRGHRTIGLTLIEMTLVIATIALLVGFAVPAVRTLVDSFQSEGGTRSMVNAALNSARTMAMTNQRYVGVRFQKICTSDDPQDPLKDVVDAPQYMIFIIHEEPKAMGSLANGFRVIDGLEPIKLPDTMGVLDLTRVTSDEDIDEPFELSDATTFSIVFSPSGKLLVHDVRVRNRDGRYRPRNDPAATETSLDDVFNSADNICLYGQGMFIQDDYSRRNPSRQDDIEFGLGEEPSRTSFVIYGAPTLQPAYARKTLWTEYLSRLATAALYVSPYTGNLIAPD